MSKLKAQARPRSHNAYFLFPDFKLGAHQTGRAGVVDVEEDAAGPGAPAVQLEGRQTVQDSVIAAGHMFTFVFSRNQGNTLQKDKQNLAGKNELQRHCHLRHRFAEN
jgi:hypothetical protein